MTRHGATLIVVAALLLAAVVRLRVADLPLERDEGEYAYAGQLLLQGVPPYAQAYNMKFPGPYFAYAALMAVFGQTPRGIHVGLIVVNAITAIALFLLVRRILKHALAAAAATAVFSVLSLDRMVFGVAAHATHFVIFFAVPGLLLLDVARSSRRLTAFAGAGLLFGVAVIMKQHAAVYGLLALGLIGWDAWRGPRPRRAPWRPALALSAGVALPLAALGVYLEASGVFGAFWFWTVRYASEYVSVMPLSSAGPMLEGALGYVTQATLGLWLLAGAGLAALWLVRWPAEVRVWTTGIAAASALGVVPGFYFRPHYFILLLPALALLAGVTVASAERAVRPARRGAARGLALLLAALLVGRYVALEWDYLTTMTPDAISRSLYSANPFVEAPVIGRYLREHSAPADRIGIFGSEPEVLFYADRRSASGYLYTYPFFEQQADAGRMIADWMREIETARPPYIVYASIGSSWMEHPDSGQAVVSWAKAYVRSCYAIVGVADIGPEGTTYVWDAAAPGYQVRHENVVFTLKRTTDGPCTASR